MDMVERYLDTVHYVPMDFQIPGEIQGVWQTRERHVTDGHREVQYFTEGDVIQAGDAWFCAHLVFHDNLLVYELRVTDEPLTQTVGRFFRSQTFNIMDQAESVCLHPVFTDGPTVSKESKRKAYWTSVTHATTDPVATANINRMRQDDAAAAWAGSDDPNEALVFVNKLARTYPGVKSIGGSFKWGYCYTCGLELPQKEKLKGRVCRVCLAQRSQTGLALLIANGARVCNRVVPVRYPGMVKLKAAHPPLKAGTATLATPLNFEVKGTTLAEVLSREPLERAGATLGGVAIDGACPFTTAGGARPLVEAILYRVFKAVAAIIDPAGFTNATGLARSPYLLGSFLQERQKMLLWDWFLSLKRSSRRKILIKAYLDMKKRGEHAPGFEFIQAFVKTELLPHFAKGQAGPDRTKVKYVARLIQAPHDETHIIAGPYLKPLIPALKEVWNEANWIFYASTGPAKLNKWLKRNCTAASWFWSDYSAFDATWSPEAWAMVEGFYDMIYPGADPELKRVFEIWRKPHGKMFSRKDDIKIEYLANVCNASGRDDTALANALLNGIVLSMSFAAALAGKLPSAVTEADLRYASEVVQIAIVGDDSLCACSFDVTPLKATIEQHIQSFGLQVVAESSHSLVDVTFLGMMPYMAQGTYTWGPTIGRRMYKAYWKADQAGSIPAWTNGVAQQMSQWTNVPILCDLAKRVQELLKGHAVFTPQSDLEWKPWTAVPDSLPCWDESTLDWLCARYQGLTKPMIYEDLRTIQSINRLPAVAFLWTTEIACNQDDL